MSSPLHVRILALVLAATALVFSGCGDDDSSAPPPPAATATRTPTLAAATATRTATPSATSAPRTNTPTIVIVEPTNSPSSTPTATRPPTATPTETATATATATTPPVVLRRPSKSSSVAVAAADSLVVMTNPDGDSISIFSTADNTLLATVETGRAPSAVVIHPDNNHAFVANRGDATVVQVSGLADPNSIVVSDPIPVGSEPTGLALSPTGKKLFVAEWAEGRVSRIDTDTLVIDASATGIRNPRGLTVTNDGDGEDNDELLVVSEFYGALNPDIDGCPSGTSEVCDTGRLGRVLSYAVFDMLAADPPGVTFSPIDSGFRPSTAAPETPTVMTSPNQLYGAAVVGYKVYVPSVSASPQGPLNFQANVFPVLYVGDLVTGEEDRSATGTANLARLVTDAIPDGSGTDRFFLEEIVDLAFDDPNTLYVVSRAADVVQRVNYGSGGTTIGTDAVKQINLAPDCQNPTGIAISSDLRRAYVNCWITRRLGVIDLEAQALIASVQSTPLPGAGTSADDIRLGARFYFTGRVRWSDEGEGYSSCGSCHPDGLTDNITWSFAAGPRQTTAMDGSFAGTPTSQRILNWTAIFDEIHDFERNTRGVSGGLGAITTSETNMCAVLAEEQQVAIPADGLGLPVKEIQDTTPGICTHDWDKVEAFAKTIRAPKGLRTLDQDAVGRGRELFAGDFACSKCHAGPAWTLSRRFWIPSAANNAALMSAPFAPPTDDVNYWPLQTVQIGPQPAAADDTGDVIQPNEVACVLRNVDTFGVPGNDALTDTLEVKVNGPRAQGHGGFNIPSLFGLSVGAPYLHHGQAKTLTELLTAEEWGIHLTAGNPNFTPSEAQIADLTAFLLSIDENTAPLGAPDPYDACPLVFPGGQRFGATLSGAGEVPVVETDATGGAVFILNQERNAIGFELRYTGLVQADVLQAHIHVGPSDMNGPVVAFLGAGPFPSSQRGILTSANLIPNAAAGINTFDDLIAAMQAGNTYTNIHTAQHQSGEIRGQNAALATFQTILSGTNEVPSVDSTATGNATVVVAADQQSITFELNTIGLATDQITMAHIHVGTADINGGVALFLSAGPFTSPLRGTLTAADFLPLPGQGVNTFADFLAKLAAGETYANVHTQTHMGGEIRGQLTNVSEGGGG